MCCSNCFMSNDIYVRNIPPAIPRMFFLNEAREVNSAIAELRTRATGHVSRCLGLGCIHHTQQLGADAFCTWKTWKHQTWEFQLFQFETQTGMMLNAESASNLPRLISANDLTGVSKFPVGITQLVLFGSSATCWWNLA